jgi:GNAT superfamily N-acetyltransferase
MTSIAVLNYLSDPDLDVELADLSYAGLLGWPDQHPITASMVCSLLRPNGMTATTLALHRDEQRMLLGAAAVCWPATLDAPGRLWGPIVHPHARGNGIGRALLSSIVQIIATRPGTQVTTASIPDMRAAGWLLFEEAGWQRCSSSNLLTRALPAADLAPVMPVVTVRTVRPGEYLDRELADLYTASVPYAGHVAARDTYTRWTTDPRYTPDGLLLVDGERGLLGAAMVYSAQSDNADGPIEASIADFLVRLDLDDTSMAAVRTALIDAALRAATAMGAQAVRTLAACPHLTEAMLAAGFRLADHTRYYAPPAIVDTTVERFGTLAPVR